MKNVKKILSILLVGALVLSFTACGKEKKTDEPKQQDEKTDVPEKKEMVSPIPEGDYDTQSAAIYKEALGGFKEFYAEAKESTNISERYALMALAEAKLLESGVLLPGTTRGGNYGIARLAKRSSPTVLWGNDADRKHDTIVTTELIKAEDNNHLKEMWEELKGTGTYAEEAVKYLEEKGYTLKDTLTQGYTSDPETWDVLNTYRQPDAEAIVNTFDGLMEYDSENVQQPALAESYEVSDDGLKYTFHLRSGVEWVDSQGRKVADLKADDFVAAMQHLLDAQGGLEGVAAPVILNAQQYMDGEVGFEEVGVKAVDELTVEYTLTQPTSYFITMLGYSIFAPMSRDFFVSKGGAFGLDEFAAALESDSYTYGKTSDDIAYCGPYLVTNATAENTIVFDANPGYWNKDNVRIHTITWMFNDGKDPTKAYNDAKSGVIDGCGLSAAALEACKADGLFEDYTTVSDTDGTTFVAFVNMYRQLYANFSDNTKAVSVKNDEQKLASEIALYNVHFRRAIGMGLDMPTYNGQVVGEELKLLSVRNSYTPGNFVSLPEEAKVSVNGTEKTYPAGTYYGEIMQDQIDADGVKIKVWDREKKTGDGFAGWYNPDNAMEELKIAIEEVKEYGLEISPENPVVLDLPAFSANEIYANRANVMKQSLEKSLGGNVVVNIVECADAKEWYDAGFYGKTAADNNYDIYDVSGWGPDYGDPSTYLDTMLDEYAGSMTKCIGVY